MSKKNNLTQKVWTQSSRYDYCHGPTTQLHHPPAARRRHSAWPPPVVVEPARVVATHQRRPHGVGNPRWWHDHHAKWPERHLVWWSEFSLEFFAQRWNLFRFWEAKKNSSKSLYFMNSVDNGWNYGSWLLKSHLKWRYRIYQNSKILYNIYTYNIDRKSSEPSTPTLHQSWRPDFGPLSHLRYRPTSRWNPTAPPRHSCHPPTCYSPTWWLDHHGAVQPRHLQWPRFLDIMDLTREAGENQDV